MFKRKRKDSYHASFDNEGNITGFYHDAISPVPKGIDAIKITDKEWEECQKGPHLWQIKDGKLRKAKK